MNKSGEKTHVFPRGPSARPLLQLVLLQLLRFAALQLPGTIAIPAALVAARLRPRALLPAHERWRLPEQPGRAAARRAAYCRGTGATKLRVAHVHPA